MLDDRFFLAGVHYVKSTWFSAVATRACALVAMQSLSYNSSTTVYVFGRHVNFVRIQNEDVSAFDVVSIVYIELEKTCVAEASVFMMFYWRSPMS